MYMSPLRSRKPVSSLLKSGLVGRSSSCQRDCHSSCRFAWCHCRYPSNLNSQHVCKHIIYERTWRGPFQSNHHSRVILIRPNMTSKAILLPTDSQTSIIAIAYIMPLGIMLVDIVCIIRHITQGKNSLLVSNVWTRRILDGPSICEDVYVVL